MSVNEKSPQVLIVGAGPSGLAAAIELGMRGIRVLVIDRNAREGMAPRAKTTNVRTRTHLRRWGIADRLAAEAPFGIEYPNDMIFVTRLSGHKLAHFRDAFNAAPTRNPLYPEHAQWVPQYKLEKVLLERARTLPGVEVRFKTRFVTATQNAEQVVATLADAAGNESEIRADYLVGADGARSTVRELIGVRSDNVRKLAHSYNIIFRAPGFAREHKHDKAVMYLQVGQHGASAIGPMDSDDRWFFMPMGVPEGKALSDREAIDLIRERSGLQSPIEILSADSWVASVWIAERYRDARMLLAGDACHLHPPTGGYGMNMGIGDGVDLGWKLSAVLQGWATDDLLDSYQAERRPLHQVVIEEAVANFTAPPTPPALIEQGGWLGRGLRALIGGKIQKTKAREYHTLGTVLGLGYEGSPCVASESGVAPAHDNRHYTPTARPGFLAPHAWLADGRSLYDLFGQGFTLLVTAAVDPAQIALAEHEAAALGVPLLVVQLGDVQLERLYGAKLALIRPDQHVTWRGAQWRVGILTTATGGAQRPGASLTFEAHREKPEACPL